MTSTAIVQKLWSYSNALRDEASILKEGIHPIVNNLSTSAFQHLCVK